MKTNMDDSRIENLSELSAFVEGLSKTKLCVESLLERYILIKTTIEKFGYAHVHKNQVNNINPFLINFFNPYLNYYRPCLYPTR